MCIVHYILHDCDLLKLGKHTHSTCEQNIPVWEREARILHKNIHKQSKQKSNSVDSHSAFQFHAGFITKRKRTS